MSSLHSQSYIYYCVVYVYVVKMEALKKYEITMYTKDIETAKVEFETEDIHDDIWDALFSIVSAANPKDKMSTSNHDFVNNGFDDLTFDETGFTAIEGDTMVVARRV